jgi:5-methylcytosine-specific restriction endonuclease McrA
MPVKDQSEYPGGSLRSREWLAIRGLVLHEQGYRCAWCGVPDRTVIVRWPDGTWDRAQAGDRQTFIVLTIAHVDHRTRNNTRGNLRALCQRCHNRHDAPHRRANAERTRRARMAVGDLLEVTP